MFCVVSELVFLYIHSIIVFVCTPVCARVRGCMRARLCVCVCGCVCVLGWGGGGGCMRCVSRYALVYSLSSFLQCSSGLQVSVRDLLAQWQVSCFA